eukprot:14465710-Heterocapsa_arctica.AAC.1
MRCIGLSVLRCNFASPLAPARWRRRTAGRAARARARIGEERARDAESGSEAACRFDSIDKIGVERAA